MTRLAVIQREKCSRERCGWQCIKVCPVNRMGSECIVKDEEGWPVISEDLCSGCGICPKKCPQKCIKIINLAGEKGVLIHQYGVNAFRLFNLPLPKQGSVVGLIGANGIGKTTALGILAGVLKPNLGDLQSERGMEEVVDAFKGQEIQNYFETVLDKEVRVSLKPQNVDKIPDAIKGNVRGLLEKADDRGELEKAVELFELEEIIDREIEHLSGGELQRVAICAAYLKNADVYYLDEPTSYLDIKQRMKIARNLRALAESSGKSVMVVEHDLAVLDYLSEYVHVFYGENSAYGVVSHLKGARNGVNEYLDGYLKDENVRFRQRPITFAAMAEEGERKSLVAFKYPAMKKAWKDFKLECDAGEVRKGEIIGIVGENAIGKTSFIKLLAGVDEPDEGDVAHKLKVSYKPQYVKADFDGTVGELISSTPIDREVFESEIKRKLDIGDLMEKEVKSLSGGELQRVSIAVALAREADVYLFDEPSAFLDVEQRLNFSDVLKKVISLKEKTAFVVDHDIVLVDSISSRLLVFEGESSVHGHALAPADKREGMNSFLKGMEVTLRRDRDSKRPRVNKPGSQMDREQKKAGEYYYYSK